MIVSLKALQSQGVKVKQGAEFFFKGEQHFGSGGYYANFKVFYGEADIQEVERYRDSFIYKIKYKVIPKSDYCIVVGRHRDDIGSGRTFEGHGVFLLIKEDISIPIDIDIPDEVWEKLEKYL